MAQVERENKEAAAQARQQSAAQEGGGWFSWAWSRQPAAAADAEPRGDLSEEEYRKIVQLVAEREDALAGGAPSADAAQHARHSLSAGSWHWGSACNALRTAAIFEFKLNQVE